MRSLEKFKCLFFYILIMKKILFAIMLAVIILSVVAISGCTTGGLINTCRSSCDQQFERCNYNCGSGWFAGACKAGCTNDHSKCLSNC